MKLLLYAPVLLIPLLTVTAGCGSSPTAPTPIPEPAALSVRVQLTDTVSGAVLGTSVHSVNTLPALLTFTVPGHVTRTAAVRSTSATVDLIPESGFDLAFYRQLARNGYESPGNLEPLRVLSQAPSVYLQRTSLTDVNVAVLEQAARMAVYEFSGHRFSVVIFESGTELRTDRAGWIIVETVDDSSAPCGSGLLGAAAGHLWLNANAKCHYRGNRIDPSVLGHEIGHAFGFWHVGIEGALMSPVRHEWGSVVITEIERHHAAIAYARQSGNRDIDVDSLGAVISAPRMVID